MINSTMITIESWFLSFNSIMIITTSLSIILGLIFLFIVIIHRRCWSISMLLICNSCLVEVLLSCVLLSMAIFTFQNDFKTGDRQYFILCSDKFFMLCDWCYAKLFISINSNVSIYVCSLSSSTFMAISEVSNCSHHWTMDIEYCVCCSIANNRANSL
jgi:hypothetical protein